MEVTEMIETVLSLKMFAIVISLIVILLSLIVFIYKAIKEGIYELTLQGYIDCVFDWISSII